MLPKKDDDHKNINGFICGQAQSFLLDYGEIL
jgi:hypothetical protein